MQSFAARLATRIASGYPLGVAGERLSAEDRRTYEAVLTALPALWQRRTDPRGQTLVHGDVHFWNFLYPRDPERHHTRMLDWQLCHICPGAKDLAYAIVLRYPHRTPAIDHVQRYHDRLMIHGVENYSWADALPHALDQ